MIALLSIVFLLILAGGAFAGANFCAPGGGAQQALLGLGGALVGVILPSLPVYLQGLTASKARDTQAGHGTPSIFLLYACTTLAVVFAMVLPSMGCRVKPDVFFESVVDCAKVNPEKSPAQAAVLTCLLGAVSGNPAACLSGLVTEAHWSINEIACVVADLAQKENTKVGTTLEDPKTRPVRNAAADWLARERIRISNTYPGQ
jgi:hypothetical protein